MTWIGPDPKSLEGDTRIVSFGNPNIVCELLIRASGLRHDADAIQALPLGIFYRAISMPNRKPQLTRPSPDVTRVNHGFSDPIFMEHRERRTPQSWEFYNVCNYESAMCNYKRHPQFLNFNCDISNRFACLEGLALPD